MRSLESVADRVREEVNDRIQRKFLEVAPELLSNWMTDDGVALAKRLDTAERKGASVAVLTGIYDLDGVALPLQDAAGGKRLWGWRRALTSRFRNVLRYKRDGDDADVRLHFEPARTETAVELLKRELEMSDQLRPSDTGVDERIGEPGHGIIQTRWLNESIARIPVTINGERSFIDIGDLPQEIQGDYLGKLFDRMAFHLNKNQFHKGFFETLSDIQNVIDAYRETAPLVQLENCPIVNSQSIATVMHPVFVANGAMVAAMSGQVYIWDPAAEDERGPGTSGALRFGAADLRIIDDLPTEGRFTQGVSFTYEAKALYPEAIARNIGVPERSIRNAFYICDGESDLQAIARLKCHIILVFDPFSEVALGQSKRAFAAADRIYPTPNKLRPAPATTNYSEYSARPVSWYQEQGRNLREAIVSLGQRPNEDRVRELIRQHFVIRRPDDTATETHLTDLKDCPSGREVLLSHTTASLVIEDLVQRDFLSDDFNMGDSFNPAPLTTVENFNALVDRRIESIPELASTSFPSAALKFKNL